MRVAIVAGESSGDLLGAALIDSIRKLCPEASFEGVGGDRMIAKGFQSHFPMETLSVMGLVEPLKRLPTLLAIKKNLVGRFLNNPPDVFIGIDSPEFNHRIELPLKKRGIHTVHYVSPSVWAWRQGRVKGIRKAVDLMLCLLPFEADFYHRESVPAKFVGHPMADEIPVEILPSPDVELDNLCQPDAINIAMLPGSRASEIEKIAPVFLGVAERLLSNQPNMNFFIPAAHKKAQKLLGEMVDGREKIHVIQGKIREILARSNAALVASGTATLEALLMKCPMVVAYKTDWFSWFIGSRLVQCEYISLANLIAGEKLVEERLQAECNVDQLVLDLQHILNDDNRENMVGKFVLLHQKLKHNASDAAAAAIMELVNQ
jgi:lipid-A-disaccharide synthase